MRPEDPGSILHVVLVPFDARPTAATRAAWSAEIGEVLRRERAQLRASRHPEGGLPPSSHQDGGGQARPRAEGEAEKVEQISEGARNRLSLEGFSEDRHIGGRSRL